MLIIGERINSSRKPISTAIASQDKAFIQNEAKAQTSAGAHYIDVNAGTFLEEETEHLKWIIEAVQDVTDLPLCIDSPDPSAIEAGLSVLKGTAMVNSISLEKERYEKMLPIIAGTDLKVVALCMSDAGMPETADQRLSIADELINKLIGSNIRIENIFVDPLVQPVATNNIFGFEFLTVIDQIRTRFKGVHTMCGLSNISYGLPERKLLNRNFMVMAIAKGLDGAIVNPLDSHMMACITAAETLAGKDDFCMNYINAYREKKFEF